jgi:hypothetical protein
MWKLLRNLLLTAILLAGVLKLLAWYEVGQDAQRITAALAPYAEIHYDSLSAGLDGNVSLGGVNVTVKRGTARDAYHAAAVVLESPGVFWLLKHALFNDNGLPSRFGVSVTGLKLPATPWLDPQWLNTSTVVPFESMGCGAALVPADYGKMGVSLGEARQRLDYRYDADSKTLDLTLTMSSPGTARLALEAEAHPFDPKASVVLDKLHVDQLSLDYADLGYLQRRNRFCGQRTNIGPGQFAEQHVEAVQALLQQHGIQPGSELVKLYRHLVENGGRASILSLPSSGFVVGTGLTLAPEDLLRQLNVTARYEDTPPVMFRLGFVASADAEGLAAASDPATPASAVAVAAVAAATTTPPASTTAGSSSAATRPGSTAATPAVSGQAAELAHASGDKTDARANPTPKPATATPPSPPAHPREPNLGMSELDRAEARLPPPPKPMSSRTAPDFLPSSPAPPPGSTLALVWKPTIERLATPAPEYRDYDIIEYARLRDEQGRRVRLITEGGKKVEGYVIAADDLGVEIRVNGGGGGAQFVVPKTRIREVQLMHRLLPPG